MYSADRKQVNAKWYEVGLEVAKRTKCCNSVANGDKAGGRRSNADSDVKLKREAESQIDQSGQPIVISKIRWLAPMRRAPTCYPSEWLVNLSAVAARFNARLPVAGQQCQALIDCAR